MGLKDKEIADSVPSMIELAEQIFAMFGAESDGGRKVTKEEWKALGKSLLALGSKILVDVID